MRDATRQIGPEEGVEANGWAGAGGRLKKLGATGKEVDGTATSTMASISVGRGQRLESDDGERHTVPQLQ